MKFEYDGKECGLECVAYIGSCGELIIKTDEGVTLMYEDETPNHGGFSDWEEGRAVHKFYPGDKITITF